MSLENQLCKGLIAAITGPKIPGVSRLAIKDNEVLGVPQRTYGYLTPAIKDRYEIDKLQTGNVFTCIALVGFNRNGAFLSHLDKLIIEEVPSMIEKLAEKLGGKFNFHVFKSEGHEQAQDYLPWLREEVLKRYALQISEHSKGMAHLLRIGISLNGQLFYPDKCVKNEALYKGENALFRDVPSSEINFRTYLGCINEMEGIV